MKDVLIPPERPLTACDIVALLAAKHADDVFVPECKDGPTWAGSHARLDAWAMKRSWTDPRTWGYEVKVARSDFLRDDKWRAYLPMCEAFAFVAPKGLIGAAEVPAEAGLIEVLKGGRLVTRKKAPRREVAIPETLYRYLLMSRTTVKGEDDGTGSLEYWREWLAKRAEARRIGYQVAKGIRERAFELEVEANRLREENARYAMVRKVMEELGLRDDGWLHERDVRDKLGQAIAALPKGLREALTAAQGRCQEALRALDALASRAERETARRAAQEAVAEERAAAEGRVARVLQAPE